MSKLLHNIQITYRPLKSGMYLSTDFGYMLHVSNNKAKIRGRGDEWYTPSSFFGVYQPDLEKTSFVYNVQYWERIK